MHHTYMCIIVTCIRIGYASYMHVSGSRIIDTCIIDTCILDTCIMDTSAWVTQPERPKGAKDEVKEAQRATD